MNAFLNPDTTFIDLGEKEYQEAWHYQLDLFNRILQTKMSNRGRLPEEQTPTENFLLFVQHPHVFTLGKSGDPQNLLLDMEALSLLGAKYYPVNRGGDITYHGPGQIVGYPVIDLENFFTDIHKYMRLLEEAVIATLLQFGISGGRIPGLTGVWIDHDAECPRKICALGVKASRWVTMHGFALNVNTDLSFFDHIVPCGIRDKAVTSMASELSGAQDLEVVSGILRKEIARVFGMNLR